MKLSVIVPVYNRFENLRALIICLMNQKIQPYELLIADDGSSQNLEEFIGDLLPKIKFKVKHIYQEDKGFRKTRALNNGARNSEGDVLVLCDQDLIFPEDYLEKIQTNIKKGEFLMGRLHYTTQEEKNKIIDILNNGGDYSKVIENINKDYIKAVEKLYKTDRRRRIMKNLFLSKRGIKLAGASCAIFKKDYISVNGYDEKYQAWGCEDDDFSNRLGVNNIFGRELITDLIQLHLAHLLSPTADKSINEEYYYSRKKEIFETKNGFCEFGYNNTIDKDEIIIRNIK